MAIALAAQTTADGTTSAPSLAVGPLSCSAGDLLILQFAGRDGTNAISSVVGSLNGAFTRVGSDRINGNLVASIWRFENSAAGDETVTITYAANSRGEANLSRWTGAPTSNVLDQNSGADNTSTTAHVNGTISATGAGVIISTFSFSGDEGTPTHDGFTAMSETAFARGYFSYRIISGAESNDSDLAVGPSLSSAGKIANFLETASTARRKNRGMLMGWAKPYTIKKCASERRN